jgi:hypothetical protein
MPTAFGKQNAPALLKENALSDESIPPEPSVADGSGGRG